MKFRAIFEVKNKEDERCIYLTADNRDKAKEIIISEISKLYKCGADEIEFYNLISEFEDSSAVNDFAVGWSAGKVIAKEENALIIKGFT